MALLDTTARRSATIQTLEDTVVVKVNEKEFTKIANKHPDVWRKLAIVIAQRLRERSKYHTVPRSQPVIFIGSSTEGLPLAQSINNYLSRCQCVPRLWSNDIFECSQTTISDLLKTTRESDFAILVLTPDDIVETRKKRKASPRDNVIFEIGLFMGALSLERTYIIVPQKLNIKIPTDLLGITFLTYSVRKKIGVARCMTPISKKLKQLITKYGPI
jgi:predicted nucleotide-binding protein